MIHWKTALRTLSALAGFFWVPALAFAEEASRSADTIRDTGVSGLWILANISYAGMRAQNNPHAGWRVLAFIFGMPGTILSFIVVGEGGGRAYGIVLPVQQPSPPAGS
jgi:hypothetical protein